MSDAVRETLSNIIGAEFSTEDDKAWRIVLEAISNDIVKGMK